MPLQEVLLVYKLRRSTLAEWVKRYASAQYRNNRKKPARHLKRSAVRAITNGTMTITEVMEACKVKTAHTIKEWLMIYQQEENSDLAALNSIVLKKPKSIETPQSNNEQIKELQQQLADAHLKIAALNTLIDVAEEQLKINIRKKPGAKQS
jgi:transposase